MIRSLQNRMILPILPEAKYTSIPKTPYPKLKSVSLNAQLKPYHAQERITPCTGKQQMTF